MNLNNHIHSLVGFLPSIFNYEPSHSWGGFSNIILKGGNKINE